MGFTLELVGVSGYQFPIIQFDNIANEIIRQLSCHDQLEWPNLQSTKMLFNRQYTVPRRSVIPLHLLVERESCG